MSSWNSHSKRFGAPVLSGLSLSNHYKRIEASATADASNGDAPSSSVTRPQETYTITHGQKKYTLSQDDVDWVRKAYQDTFESHYDADDEDQNRRKQRIMPRSYERGYQNSKLDSQLYELGLPSSRYLDSYVSGLHEYRTAEEAARQVIQAAQGRIDAFYGTVAQKWVDNKISGIGNVAETFTREDGSTVLGSELYENAFYDTLDSDEWSDIRGLFKSRPAADKGPDDYPSTAAYREAQIAERNKADAAAKKAEEKALEDPLSTLSFSYDDFVNQYGNIEKQIKTREVARDALGDVVTVGWLLDEGERMAKASLYRSITDKKSARAFVDKHASGDTSFADMLLEMHDAGLNRDQVRWAKNRMKELAPDKAAKDAIDDSWKGLDWTNPSTGNPTASGEDVIADIKGFFSPGSDRVKAANAAIDTAAETYRTGATSALTADEAARVFLSHLRYNDNGTISADSIGPAVDQLAAAGASTAIIRQAAEGAFAGLSRAGNIGAGDMRSVQTSDILDVRGVLDDKLAALDLEDRTLLATDMRAELLAKGYTDFEVDQALSIKGWQDTLDPAARARNFYMEYDFPSLMEGDDLMRDRWAKLSGADKLAVAQEQWDALGADGQAAYIEDFDKGKDFNPALNKSYSQQIAMQFGAGVLTRVITGLASGAINLADMATAGISGRTERWAASIAADELNAAATSYGKAANQDVWSNLISTGADITSELTRMYTLGSAGGRLLGFAGKLAPGVFNVSAKASKGVQLLQKGAIAAVKSNPFIANAMGGYYAEAMQNGATVEEATEYGIVCGVLEGAVEALNVDTLWGRVLGKDKVATQLMNATRAMQQPIVNKARLVSLATGFLGEFAEESMSYAASVYMQGQTFNPGAPFNVWEMTKQGFMGGLVGAAGAAVQLPSITASSIMADHITKNAAYSPTNLDLLFTATQVDAMSDERVAQLTESGKILDSEAFRSRMRSLVFATKQVDNATHAYEETVATLDAKRDKLQDRYYNLAFQLGRIDPVAEPGKWAKQAAKANEAKAELDAFLPKHAEDTATAERAYQQSVSQNNATIEDAREAIDGHYVALYNVFKDDYAAIAKGALADTARGEAQQRYALSAEEVDAIMSSGAVDADAYDAAVERMGAEANASAQADTDAEEAAAVTSRTEEKMRAVKAGKLDEYQEGQQAKAAPSDASQTAAASVERTVLPQSDRDAVASIGQRLGRPVEFRALKPWVDGFYENGKLILNEAQRPSANRTPFQATVYRVLVHELTHSIEGTRAYNDFSEYVMQREMEASGMSAAQLYALQRAAYADNSGGEVNLTDGQARREIVAKWAGENLLQSEDAINTIVQEQSGLAGRVLNWVQYQIAKTDARNNPNSGDALALLKAERMYVKAFAASGNSPSEGMRQYMFSTDANRSGLAHAAGANVVTFKRFDENGNAFFIDDSKADVDTELLLFSPEGTVVSDVLQHDALFSAYPELADVRVVLSNKKTSDIASYSPVTKTLSIYKDALSRLGNESRLASAFMHEVQHAVQDIDGLYHGSNTENAAIDLFNQVCASVMSDPAFKKLKAAEKRNAVGNAFLAMVGGDRKTWRNSDAIYNHYKNTIGEREAFYTGDAFGATEKQRSILGSPGTVHEPGSAGSPIDGYGIRKILLDNVKALGYADVSHIIYSVGNKSNVTDAEDVLYGIAHAAENGDLYYGTPATGLPVETLRRDGRESGGTGSGGGQAGTDSGTEGLTEQEAPEPGASSLPGFLSPGAEADGTIMYAVPTGTWAELAAKYGTIEQGKGPRARDADAPKQTDDKTYVSYAARSILESSHIADDVVPVVQQRILNGEIGTHARVSNAETLEIAHRKIERVGVAQAHEEFAAAVASGRVNKDTVALGEQLLAEAGGRGDTAACLSLISDLCIAATESGRTTQAFAMLKELGPLGAAYYLNRLVSRLNAKYSTDIDNGRMQEITIDSGLMSDLIDAKTEDEVRAVESAISRHIGQQLPLSLVDQLSNWRYFSMLANPVTHVRNMTGNAAMMALRAGKDAVATMLERGAVSAGLMQQTDRTHAVYLTQNQQARVELARRLFDKYEPDIVSGGKFGFEEMVRREAKLFNKQALDALARFNFNALEKEDVWFMRPAFISAMTQYMVAQDIDPSAMTPEQEAAAATWAIEEAQRATFRDASALATLLNKASNLNNISRLVVEGLVPFKKTPINIAKRGIDYSPIGIIEGVVMATKGVKDGKYTPAQAIDRIASGITGTAAMVLGALLAKWGVLRGGGDDDENYESFLGSSGEQRYSINLGDLSIGVSSIAPVTIPIFMGVELYETASRSGDDVAGGEWFGSLVDALSSVGNPLMEMSFMASLNEALNSYNSDVGVGGNLGAVAKKGAQSYASQYLPTLGGKVAAFADPTVRTAKADATSILSGQDDSWMRGLVKKVPGLASTLEPTVNVKGEQITKDTFGEWALDFANKFVLPTTVKIKDRGSVDSEIIRVYELTGNTDIIPTSPRKYFVDNGKRTNLTAAQYTAYSTEYGTAVYASVKALIASTRYKGATDEKKAELLKKAIESAETTVRDMWKEKLG